MLTFLPFKGASILAACWAMTAVSCTHREGVRAGHSIECVNVDADIKRIIWVGMLTPWTVWTVCSMNATHSCECLPIPLSGVTLKKYFYLFNIVVDIEQSLWGPYKYCKCRGLKKYCKCRGLKKYCKCRGLKYIAHLFLVSCLTFDLTV